MGAKRQRTEKKDVTHIFVGDAEGANDNVRRGFMPDFAFVCQEVGTFEPIENGVFYRTLGAVPPEGKSWGERTRREYWDNPDKGAGGKTQYELLLERIKDKEISTPADAARDLVKWFRATEAALPEGSRAMIVTDTAGFDFALVSDLLAEHLHGTDLQCDSLLYVFGGYRPVRCMSSSQFGLAGTLAKFGSEAAAMEALELSELPEEATKVAANHHPERDARSIANHASFFVSEARKLRDSLI